MGRKPKFRGIEEELALLDENVYHEFRWRTKAGEIIKVKDMTDSHLINTRNFLRRCSSAAMSQGYSFLSMLRGEMAEICAEREIDKTENFFDDLISVFNCEIRERGLENNNDQS